MARLIDADALKDKAFGGRKGLVHTSDIDAAPTIDAIPVEWLREKMLKPQMTEGNPFGFVLAEWLEEQEAR